MELMSEYTFYQGYIKNITRDEWVHGESDNGLVLTKDENKKQYFLNESDAENALEKLNDLYSDIYVLIKEDDEGKFLRDDRFEHWISELLKGKTINLNPMFYGKFLRYVQRVGLAERFANIHRVEREYDDEVAPIVYETHLPKI